MSYFRHLKENIDMQFEFIFGRNMGHGQMNMLNVGLYPESIDIASDMSYPEYATGRPRGTA
ncbi:TPA: hypothetical protein EYP70_02345 [Candidatus Bathyarchaeota archaeon]|nr:hypothetical protein [Candidatus Bathyarchaeota archaeon]